MAAFIRSKNFWLPALALTAGFALYALNLPNGLFWDDNDWIVNNITVHGLDWEYIKFWFTNNTLAGIGLTSNYYRPFLFFTFAFNYVIGGTNPVGYHLVNNLIHLANGLLVFLLLGRAFRPSGDFSWAALLTALVFLIHPVQTEAVSYISGRGDPLSVLLMLLALWLFLRAEQSGGGRWHWRRLASLLCLTLALLSRETAIIFPLLLVLWQVALAAPRLALWPGFWRAMKKALPYLAIVLAYGWLRLTVLNFQNTLNFYTAQNVYSEHLSVRLYTFFHSLLLYLKLLLWPAGLHMERAVPVFVSLWQWPVWAVAAGWLVLLWWLFRLYRRERRLPARADGTTSSFRVWLFAAGWFFIGLGPVSGVTPINALFYEHWLYLPLVGFFALIFFYGEKLWRWLRLQRFGRVVLTSGLMVYLLFFGAQTAVRNRLWGNPIAFFEDILRYETGSARVLNNLGNLYYDQGDRARSVNYYERSIAVGDIFPQPHYNLGAIAQADGDYHAAIQHYEAALQLDPGFYYPYPNLIAIYSAQGNYRRALDYAQKHRQLRPADPRVYYNLAILQKASGDRAAARLSASEGLARSQYDPEIRRQLEELAKTL